MDDIRIYFRGVSEFYYFAISLVLGGAACVWLFFFDGLHIFRRTLSKERRHALATRSFPYPKTKIEITFGGSKSEPVKPYKAEIDGKEAWLWYENTGSVSRRYIDYYYKLYAVDGTVVDACHGAASASELDAGEKAEMKFTIWKPDPRAVRLDVQMSSHPRAGLWRG
jgi:hypothetical protein